MMLYKNIIIIIVIFIIIFIYYVTEGGGIKYFPIPTNYSFFLSSLSCDNSIEENQSRLYTQGAACGLGKIPTLLCDTVKKEIMAWKQTANKTMYGHINTKIGRYDLFMPLKGGTLEIVKKLLISWKVNNVSLYNPDATIIEVASFITLPGAIGQRIHVDTSDKIHHKDVLSFGVFLQDIDNKLAPLVVKPDNSLIPWWYCITGNKGDVYGWSAIVEHGGGANHTKHTRYLFYITILYPPLKKVEVGDYSLLPIYGNGIRVSELV